MLLVRSPRIAHSTLDNTRSHAAPLKVPMTFLAALLMALLPLASARAQIFSNNAPISIPSAGTATPYPSTINVTGVPDGTSVRVRLKNFTHTFPADVGVLLVAPDGQSHQLIAPIPGSSGFPVSGITLTLDADAQTPLPNPLVTGTFRAAGGNQVYAAPANTFPRTNVLGSLLGTPNGAWRLFVQDFAAGDLGSIAGGWEIEFFDVPQPRISNEFTYQGRLDGGIADGFIDARFSLWNGRNSGNPSNLLAGPVDVSFIPIRGGLFTASVDLGIPLPTDIQTFLQVEVASPSGSGYVALSPRQPMTAAPLASVAAGLGNVTSLPGGNSVISGPQGNSQTGSLTLRAPGVVVSSGSGSQGGLLRLVAGNANTGAAAPPTGTSAGNDVHIVAGDNVFAGFSSDLWNGNIQFFAGDLQPERMRIVGDNGFVGIGTTNPVANLDVRGSIALGSNGELRAAGGEENLRIIRGSFRGNGTIFNGSGFNVTRQGTGDYFVSFTAFSDDPTVTATAFAPVNQNLNVVIQGLDDDFVQFRVFNASGTLTDSTIHFIAIGAR
jgi:subtilisin-like proprotein convertase family protein